MAIRIASGRKTSMSKLQYRQMAISDDTEEVFIGTPSKYMKLLDEKDLSNIPKKVNGKTPDNVGNIQIDIPDISKLITKEDLQNIGSATPKGVFTTLTELQTAFPTGTDGIYIIASDGKWYYWNNNSWMAGGQYQSTGISQNAVKKIQLSPELQTLFSDIFTNATLPETILDKYYDMNDGKLITGTGSKAYNPIEVSPGETYKISGFSRWLANLYVIVDANDKIISSFPKLNEALKEYKNIEFTIPPNGKQLKINHNGETSLQKVTHYSLMDVKNPLDYKKLLFTGDSITEGVGATTIPTGIAPFNNKGWVYAIQKNNPKSTVYGYGRAGFTVAKNGTDTNNLVSQISSYPNDMNYVLLSGGYNDRSKNIPIGGLTGSYSYEQTFDEFTFLGALESMIVQCIKKYPKAKIGYIITPKKIFFNDANNTSRQILFRQCILDACEKWSIPVCDLYTISGLIGTATTDQRTIDYYQNADGTHPNEVGYNLFLSPKVESWVKSL